MRRHEIGGHDRGKALRALGNDLKDVVGFFLRWKNIAKFIQAKDVDGGVILDHGVLVPRSFQFPDQVVTAQLISIGTVQVTIYEKKIKTWTKRAETSMSQKPGKNP